MAFFSINFFLNLHLLFCMLTFGFYAMSHFKNLYQSIFLIIIFFIIYFRTLISYFNHLLHFLSTKHFNTPSPLLTQKQPFNVILNCSTFEVPINFSTLNFKIKLSIWHVKLVLKLICLITKPIKFQVNNKLSN
jgi:hypothetical protein